MTPVAHADVDAPRRHVVLCTGVSSYGVLSYLSNDLARAFIAAGYTAEVLDLSRVAIPTELRRLVVDDALMGITHVIRGDDHLINAARQKQIYDALEWDLPNMSHIPLIHGPDGSKLSKRHGALGVDAYRAMGYLPMALRNYLVRLGWSHGDQEIFSTREMIDAFDLPGIGRRL